MKVRRLVVMLILALSLLGAAQVASADGEEKVPTPILAATDGIPTPGVL